VRAALPYGASHLKRAVASVNQEALVGNGAHMWIVAGVLLTLVVLTALGGFHVGPHAHAVSGALAAVTAMWLLVMAVTGHAVPALWGLLIADLVLLGIVAALALLARAALRRPGALPADPSLAGIMGTAVSSLSPEGVVRVRGENWSAVSVNGPVAVGDPVQVLGRHGVRLEVWAENNLGTSGADAGRPVPSWELPELDGQAPPAEERGRPAAERSDP
jgi:membrane-bound ClpP family serine protease